LFVQGIDGGGIGQRKTDFTAAARGLGRRFHGVA